MLVKTNGEKIPMMIGKSTKKENVEGEQSFERKVCLDLKKVAENERKREGGG